MIRTDLINRERVRCWRFGAAASREEGEHPSWIFDRRATPLQRQRSATLRAKVWHPAGGVGPQSQSVLAMILRRALPAACQSLAHTFPICEMGSKTGGVKDELYKSWQDGTQGIANLSGLHELRTRGERVGSG